MEMADTLCHLSNHMAGQRFAEICHLDYAVKQLAAIAKLHDKEIIFFGLSKLDQLNNVGMSNVSHDLYFFQNICPLHHNPSDFPYSFEPGDTYTLLQWLGVSASYSGADDFAGWRACNVSHCLLCSSD